MARLRLGDIEIDGNRIRIGGQNVTAPTASSTALVVRQGTAATARQAQPGAPVATASDGIDSLASLRIKPARLVLAGTFFASLGGAALAVTGLPSGIFEYVTHGGVFMPIGIGLVLMGVLKRRADERVAARTRARREAELAPLVERLRAVLPAEGTGGPTVEKLVEATGMTEADVVRALVVLRDHGEVEEELDTSTGDWFYRLVPRALAGPNSLDDRLARLEGDTPK